MLLPITKEHISVFRQVLLRNIALRYKGSVLGVIWSFAHPLMMLAVYTFVFGVVFKSRWGIEDFEDNRAAFPLIMFCGLTVFNIFAESVNSSAALIVNNPSYVKKVIFPLEILPLANVITSLFYGIAWFVLLLVGTIIFLKTVSWTILLLPLTIIPLLLFSLGLSYFIASLGVFLRDIQQFIVIVTQVLFFMTPIFYPVSVVPENLAWILKWNPLTPIVEQTRELFLYGHVPDMLTLTVVTGISFIVYQLGLAWFLKTKKGFADVL